MSSNFKNMPEHLQKRVELHQAARESKKETKVSTHKQDDEFSLTFKEGYDNIQKSLGSCPTVSEEEFTEFFDKISSEFQTLQKCLSDTSPHLSAYKIRSTQQSLMTLQDKIQEAQDTYLPKKKFNFKARPKKAVEKSNDLVDSLESVKSFVPGKPSYNDLDERGFRDLENTALKMTPEEINYKEISLCNLKRCRISLFGAPSTVRISKLTDCTVLCGPVTTSVVFEDCNNCVFVMACQQIRIHSTQDSKFYLHVVGDPIIEECQNLQFAPYNWSYSNLEEHIQMAKLNWERNSWNNVKDFNWLSTDKPSPNWSEMSVDERIGNWEV